MHTHLKGRIFSAEGVSYLVLHDDSGAPDWLQVKALNQGRQTQRMKADEVLRYVDARSTATQTE